MTSEKIRVIPVRVPNETSLQRLQQGGLGATMKNSCEPARPDFINKKKWNQVADLDLTTQEGREKLRDVLGEGVQIDFVVSSGFIDAGTDLTLLQSVKF